MAATTHQGSLRRLKQQTQQMMQTAKERRRHQMNYKRQARTVLPVARRIHDLCLWC